MVLRISLRDLLLLKTKGRCAVFFDWQPKIIFWVCLLRSRLKLIFHGKTKSSISLKSLFSLLPDALLSWVNTKIDILTFDDKPSKKSLMQIQNKSGPRIDRWGAPASNFPWKMFDQKAHPFCFLLIRKLENLFHKSPYISFLTTLKIRNLC